MKTKKYQITFVIFILFSFFFISKGVKNVTAAEVKLCSQTVTYECGDASQCVPKPGQTSCECLGAVQITCYTKPCEIIKPGCIDSYKCCKLWDRLWCVEEGTCYQERTSCPPCTNCYTKCYPTSIWGLGECWCITPPLISYCTEWSPWECNTTNCCNKRYCMSGSQETQMGSCAGGTCGQSDCPGASSGGGTPTCEGSLEPTEITVDQNVQTGFNATTSTYSGGTVSEVRFVSNDTNLVTVTSPDNISPFNTVATSLQNFGSTTITARFVMDGSVRCDATSTINIAPPGPWWQVKDADISTSGNIISLIPNTSFFNLDGSGGFPGIPQYGGFFNIGTNGSRSSTNWNVNSINSFRRGYNVDYFIRQIPENTVINEITENSIEGTYFDTQGEEYNGYYWFKFDGSTSNQDLSINSDMNIGSKKVIVIINQADLYLSGKVNLTDGQGFVLFLVSANSDGGKGNLYIDPFVGGTADNIPEIEGLYLTDNEIYLGESNLQLHIRGSLAGLGGINLQRNLDDDTTTPSEYIEFAPDQLMMLPPELRINSINWKEIAP